MLILIATTYLWGISNTRPSTFSSLWLILLIPQHCPLCMLVQSILLTWENQGQECDIPFWQPLARARLGSISSLLHIYIYWNSSSLVPDYLPLFQDLQGAPLTHLAQNSQCPQQHNHFAGPILSQPSSTLVVSHLSPLTLWALIWKGPPFRVSPQNVRSHRATFPSLFLSLPHTDSSLLTKQSTWSCFPSCIWCPLMLRLPLPS